MKIIVLVKLVPDTESSIIIDKEGKNIEKEAIKKYILNPFDEFAVEEAVKIGGETMAITLGGADSEEALRTAFAMGLGDVLRIEAPAQDGEILATAVILGEYLKKESFDLILTGKQAVDDGAAAIPSMLAEILDIPFISNIVGLNIENKIFTVKQEITGGHRILEIPSPCILSCQKGLNKPRYPKLTNLMKAKKKKIQVKTLSELGITPESAENLKKSRLRELKYPERRSGGRILQGTPQDIVQEIVKELREKVKVI